MNRTYTRLILSLAIALAAAHFAGCDRPQSSQGSADAESLPAALLLAEAPAGARDVADVRSEAAPGQEVTIRGRVGGESPFTDGRAVMTIVDPSLKSCAEEEDDACRTPWDYCCVETQTLYAHMATIQVVGADGKPLKASLRNLPGLKPLTPVIVQGTVQQGGDGQPLVINATGVHIEGT